MLLQMASFHSWLSNVPLHICTTSFSFVDGHLGCFHVLALVHSAAVKTGVRVIFLSFHLDIGPGVGLLNHTETLYLASFEEPPYCFP